MSERFDCSISSDAEGCVSISVHGVKFSPEILWSMIGRGYSRWQGPFWFRREPGQDHVVITTEEPKCL